MAEQTKVIANTVIHRTLKPGERGNRKQGIPSVPPKIQVIKAGTIFQTRDKAEYDDLKAAGAIREPDKGEKIEVDVANVVPEEDSKSRASGGGRTTTRAPSGAGETTTTGVTKHGSRTGAAASDSSDLV